MAILITAEVPGMTHEMVDGMTEQLEEQQKAQPGFVLHANGPIDGGWGVTEVWEAQENFDSWYEGTIKPDEVLVVATEVGRGAMSGAEIRSTNFELLTIRDGMIVRVREFYDEGNALEAAGLEE